MQELNELKNLVIQSLEANGALSNIRAQIRASVFRVIDQQEASNNKKGSPFYWENPKCQKLHESKEGVQMLELIKEFLAFYSMDLNAEHLLERVQPPRGSQAGLDHRKTGSQGPRGPPAASPVPHCAGIPPRK